MNGLYKADLHVHSRYSNKPYHTDIPQYVRDLSNDAFLENVAWHYMIWFYCQMEDVMVPLMSTRYQLISKGPPPYLPGKH
jgi:hypothetical protein